MNKQTASCGFLTVFFLFLKKTILQNPKLIRPCTRLDSIRKGFFKKISGNLLSDRRKAPG